MNHFKDFILDFFQDLNREVAYEDNGLKVYVTGGSGFVGKSLIKRLKEERHDVRALAVSSDDAQILKDLGAEAIVGDVNQIQVLKQSIYGCDVIIHLAAIMKIMGNYKELYQVNVDGTKNM
ncbi:MAG: NAD-dependent epimerase/dehydratase family protein, partial [Deltaproteobacteria bacterium]|nr:NAD-dependent epimerase/dehydratase family protein [Deltaproteobacteria bacterium]